MLLAGRYASRSARRRFEREIELVASLKHPNVIAVFDSGTTPDGHEYYVMDYVRGVPITQYVRDKSRRWRRSWRCSPPPARRSTTPTSVASSTATSSRATSSWTWTATCACWTSAWPRR